METKAQFHLDEVLELLKHYLPEQAPLKDFIHHNTLHSFQEFSFFEGTQRANEIFGYQVSLSLLEYRQLFHEHKIHEDAMNQVIELKFGHSAMYEWKFKMLQSEYNESKECRVGQLRNKWKSKLGWKVPGAEMNFIDSIRNLENQSHGSLFRGKIASHLLQNEHLKLEDLLFKIVGDPALYEQYLFDQQFAHPGWSGIVSAIEHNQSTLLDSRKITLTEFIMFELLIEIDVLESKYGPNFHSVRELGVSVGFNLWDKIEVLMNLRTTMKCSKELNKM